MNLLLAWWHEMLADSDDDELFDRSVRGASSDVWCANVVRLINWRREEARRLRESSTLLRLARAVRNAWADFRVRA